MTWKENEDIMYNLNFNYFLFFFYKIVILINEFFTSFSLIHLHCLDILDVVVLNKQFKLKSIHSLFIFDLVYILFTNFPNVNYADLSLEMLFSHTQKKQQILA